VLVVGVRVTDMKLLRTCVNMAASQRYAGWEVGARCVYQGQAGAGAVAGDA
jgi:hypothetical protein